MQRREAHTLPGFGGGTIRMWLVLSAAQEPETTLNG